MNTRLAESPNSASFPSEPLPENVIHELMQPLGVIETLAYYLELTADNAKTEEHARHIQAMVQKVHRILADAEPAKAAPGREPIVLARSTAS